MKRVLAYQLAATAMLALIFVSGPVAAKSPPRKGDVLPKMNLPVPKDPAHRSYLGLSGEGLFNIAEIKAQALIIEIFSMY
jgi:hypothetical protein